MKKVLHIVGARPQFIKLSPFIHKSKDVFTNLVLHTGQHYDKVMSDVFFNDLEIPNPDYNLEAGPAAQGEQTGRMLIGIEQILMIEKPDAVLVYGDTNSTLAGALAAVKLNIFTAHVEACLRSFNRTMPEEINRICADHVCSLLFAPTHAAMQNAEKEGLGQITHLVGDIMTDSLAFGLAKVEKTSSLIDELHMAAGDYYLLTLHRPYTVDDPEILLPLLEKLNSLDKRVVFPVHPRTAKMLANGPQQDLSNIIKVDPQGYLDFIRLMNSASKVLTDSGGIQKEAYILRKPCITLRPETEWLETVQSGWNLLVNPNDLALNEKISTFQSPELHPDLFGVDVAEKMIDLLDQNI